jgi:hypothetical protein
MKLAGKLRIDRADLDAFIDALKDERGDHRVRDGVRHVTAGVRHHLAPLAPSPDARKRAKESSDPARNGGRQRSGRQTPSRWSSSACPVGV